MARTKVAVMRRWLGAIPTDASGKPVPERLWPKLRPYCWEVRWWGDELTPSGNLRRYCRSFAKKTDAEQFAETKQAAVRQGDGNPLAAITLAAFHKEHSKLSVGSIKPKTLRMQLDALTMLAEVVGWGRRLQTIAARDIEAFRAKRVNAGVKPATANKNVMSLKSIFNSAIRRRYILAGKNPCVGLPMLRTTSKTPAYCSPKEFLDVLGQAGDLIWQAMLTVVYTAGLRLEEALNLVWADVDFAGGQVLVTRKDSIQWVQAWEPKDYEIRKIPVPKQAIDLLAAWQAQAPDGCPYAFMDPGRWEHYRRAVEQGTWRSGQLLVNNVLRKFQTRCRRAGVKQYTLHDLRRSCITNWASALPIHVTKELAGHSDIRTTEKFYLSVREEDIARAQQMQSELLGEMTPPKLIDAKLTHGGKKRCFPGKVGNPQKLQPPD